MTQAGLWEREIQQPTFKSTILLYAMIVAGFITYVALLPIGWIAVIVRASMADEDLLICLIGLLTTLITLMGFLYWFFIIG